MARTIAYLLGRFPVRTEGPVLAEITAIAHLGHAVRVFAFHQAPDALPPELAALEERVAFLDPARRWGRIVAGCAGIVEILRATGCRPVRGVAWDRFPATGHPLAAHWRRARLTRALLAAPPDALHAQFGHLGLLALPVTRALGIPLVVSFRGQDVALIRRVPESARAALLREAALLLVRSDDMRRDLDALGAPAAAMHVLPTGVDLDAIPFRERTPPKDRPVEVLFVGRNVAKKGWADAVRAVEACRDAAEIRLTALRDAPHDQVRAALGRADLFLLPCRTAPDGEKEGIPTAIKEAMAAGLPVVSTRHAGIPECVDDGESGFLAEEGDVAGLAAGLARLLKSPDAWAAMGRRGRAIVAARYDRRALAARLAALYEGLSRAHGPSPSVFRPITT